jgi:hypothetical protein
MSLSLACGTAWNFPSPPGHIPRRGWQDIRRKAKYSDFSLPMLPQCCFARWRRLAVAAAPKGRTMGIVHFFCSPGSLSSAHSSSGSELEYIVLFCLTRILRLSRCSIGLVVCHLVPDSELASERCQCGHSAPARPGRLARSRRRNLEASST